MMNDLITQCSLEAQNYAAELKLRAQRRMGELLPVMIRTQGQRDQTFQGGKVSPPKLSELGYSYKQSHHWQTIAGGLGVRLPLVPIGTKVPARLPWAMRRG